MDPISSSTESGGRVVRVVVADDHVLVRSLVKACLARAGGIEVVGEAADGRELLALVDALRPDVVLTDVSMPGLDGFEATRRICSDFPGVHVLMLSTHDSPQDIARARACGARGYALKDTPSALLSAAVRCVATGASWFESMPMHEQPPPPAGSPLAPEPSRERMLDATLSAITDCAYTFDREGRLLFANRHLLEIWGRSFAQVEGKNIFELGYPPALAQRLDRQLRQVVTTGRMVRDETAFVGADGQERWYEYVLSPAPGPDGAIAYGVGCSRDITERKRSELALQQSLDEFRTLACAMPHIVWMASAEGANSYLNDQWFRYTGMTPAQSDGSGWIEAVHPQDRPRVLARWRQILKSEGSFDFEMRLRRFDGAYRWWLVRTVSCLDSADRSRRWMGTCTDIHDIKLAQAQAAQANRDLQRRQAELRLLFDSVPEMIWFKDTAGTILRVNRQAARATGMRVQDMEGRSIYELLPEHAAKLQSAHRQVIETRAPLLGRVERYKDPAGGAVWLQQDLVPFLDQEGAVTGILAVARDITDRVDGQKALRDLNESLEARVRERTAALHLAREEAERANRAKSDFLAAISHEIRTPMTGLLGLLELLGLGELDEEQRATLCIAHESAKALQGILTDVLDLSKAEANSLQLEPTPGSLRALVDKVCALHREVAARKNIALQCRFSDDVEPVLLFDALRLSQVLNNFVNNAIKFTSQGTVDLEVDVLAATAQHQELRLSVRDTGAGIAPDQLPRLFQPFVQAQGTPQLGGTGLGLVISKRLVELMDGSLRLESTPGVGTTLTVQVSLARSPQAQAPAPATDWGMLKALVQSRRQGAAEDPGGDAQSVLVVDDHPVNRMVLVRQLSALGYAPQAAADGVEALQAWHSRGFRAVLTDCNMPGMSGYELARTLRQLEQAQGRERAVILGCTANAMHSALAACIDAGMDDWIPKPLGLLALRQKLDALVPLAGRGSPAGAAMPEPIPSRHAASARRPVVDAALLQEISCGDPQVHASVLAQFRRTTDEDSAALRELAQRGDHDALLDRAHRMKGACMMVGASLLAQACGGIEAACRIGDEQRLRDALAAFEIELSTLLRSLDGLAGANT